MLALPERTERTKAERRYILKMLAAASNNMQGYKTREFIPSFGIVFTVSPDGQAIARQTIFDAFRSITIVIWE